ncbi:glutamate synthase-related protein [Alicyclobacillus contaminans]|uniref:glutamate synthase-related protein n=1 Tax=Alicyclobacillus contaminans TaxID=392016 RepID=UPI000420EBA1|nr:glutamate synthase-related protein [Alicyclobacillus contaminans]
MDLNAITRTISREHDACGIFACVSKTGEPTRNTVDLGIQALVALKHRAGFVAGEGDGCGLMLDVPRGLWRRWLQAAGANPRAVMHPNFFVAHLFLQQDRSEQLLQHVRSILDQHAVDVLCVREQAVHPVALGPLAREENPYFVQLAGLTEDHHPYRLLALTTALEAVTGIHVASLDRTTVVYKVVGDGETLFQYFDDLREADYLSSFALAHTRYSTNTKTAFARVQPFRTLGHNGEINTIARFYEEAGMLGIELDAGGSDSQMVAGAVEHFTHRFGWSLYETAELFFPPIIHEIKQMPTDLADMYMHMRALWGPFAQGPAGVILRSGNEAVFSVDALGLRPMWWVETVDYHMFSSEQGVIPADEWVRDPKPISPGEKIGITWDESGRTFIHSYHELQQLVYDRMRQRYDFRDQRKSIRSPGPYPLTETAPSYHDSKPWKIRATAFGWQENDVKLLDAHLQTAAEPIKSLGHDEPLAALTNGVRSLSDFIQETVAVVTNPAIDREREIEHFSTRVLLGKRPSVEDAAQRGHRIELPSPLLIEAHLPGVDVERQDIQAVAHRFGTVCYEDALAALRDGPYGTVEVLIHRKEGETIAQCLERLRRDVVQAVQAGANVVVLDDRLQFIRGRSIDPFLALASVHKGLLRPASSRGGEHLRRRTSLILRSGGLRNLHDIMVALGLGADAVNPYLMWEAAADKGGVHGVENVYTALCKGIEKVLSTLGIHELRGYERLFSAIGLAEPVAEILGIPNFCATGEIGYGFAEMEADAAERQRLYDVAEERQLGRARSFQMYPRIWRSAGQVAEGTLPYASYVEKLQEIETENPVSLRHLLRFKTGSEAELVSADDVASVDTTIDGHAYPLVISSMSFGSQGETAYRAYAEAAYRMNIVAMNGEGGEIKDLLNAYPKNRGRQVASGRFGVNAELCNGAYVLEIKIGQGAKPGEGGHLPGSKVTVQVANARNASPGIDLISPSNNHDIYSIEDLAQVIYELRAINPLAKIAVKVPVVPNIGTIAVGIVKAGADIVELSGFDGGTGAARAHAIRHVGLPSDLGVKLVHDALCEAGLRDVAEIWVDGGMKSGIDVMKAILLGANRVGFGTMAMVAIGCTSCRACHKDTCHVGIATQMTGVEEAREKGLKQFVPQEFDLAVERLVRWFTAIGEHVRQLTAQLGAARTQDLVGRADLLEPFAKLNQVDVSWLTTRKDWTGLGTRIRYRLWETDEGEQLVASPMAVAAGTEHAAPPVYSPVGKSDASRLVASGAVGVPRIQAVPRVVGTRESGERVRVRKNADRAFELVHAYPVGNGFAAYQVTGVHQVVYGGAQDGVGKGAYGGRTVVLKRRTPDGRWVGGSVGKGLAYGAQHGLFIVQGNADARAGIRLSGADIVIGGELNGPVRDELGFIGSRANIAGFAFEYMTAGRAVVLGDPGPWICSGMTGGSVYVRLRPEWGFDEDALRRRIAKGAKVVILPLDAEGEADVVGLLSAYQKELRKSGQREAAKQLAPLLERPAEYFVMIRPGKELTDQSIATE